MKRTLNLLVLVAMLALTFGARGVTPAQAAAQDFQILTLTANNAYLAPDHYGTTGDDRGGIALSSTNLFYSGDGSTGRFAIADLSGATSVGTVYDGLTSNLANGNVYTLGGAGGPLGGGGTVTRLLEINGSTGALTGNEITLSASFIANYSAGIFAGYNRVVVHDGSTTVYEIALPSGQVTVLGSLATPSHYFCENWAYWGVTEHFGGDDYITYVQNSGYPATQIVRTRVSDGATSTVATFSTLSDMCSFTVSPSNNRWYFHHEGVSQFGGVDENVGYADATFMVGPSIRLFGTTGSGSGGSTLVELDPTTGALISTIGPVGYTVNGLDYDPTSGMLYATTGFLDPNYPNGLITIDMTTGAGTPLVPLTPVNWAVTNLRANAGGTLFGWSEDSDNLAVINPATGDVFIVGESGIGTSAYGMSFDSNNVLYFVNGGGSILTVNKYTGAASYTGNYINNYAHHGDFHPDTGRFWGISEPWSNPKTINVVNVSSGAVDASLSTVNSLHTLTFVPGNQPAVDVVEPVLTVPANITTQQNVPGGAVVTFSPTATDETSPANPATHCVPASGSVFPVGTTTVKCFTLDDQGNADFDNFDVTVTAAPGGNLLVKPDFASASVFPTPWQAFGFTKPYTNVLDCNYYNMGPCSVLFIAGNRSAMQRVNRSGVAGDDYSFGIYSAANNVPAGGKYLVEVAFYNNFNRRVGPLYQVPLAIGSHGFDLAFGTATATGNYNKITFRFYYHNPSGRSWFDDAFLFALP